MKTSITTMSVKLDIMYYFYLAELSQLGWKGDTVVAYWPI